MSAPRRSGARWPDCATGWHDRCTQPARCGCPCHTRATATGGASPQPGNQDDLFAAYFATMGTIAADDPVLLARIMRAAVAANQRAADVNGSGEADVAVGEIADKYRDPALARFAINDYRDWLAAALASPAPAPHAEEGS